MGSSVDPALRPGRVSLVFVSFVSIALVSGGNEEPGWRGLALPKLQERYASVPATLVLGVVWALWHLPLLTTGPTTFHGLAEFVAVAPSIGVRILNIVGIAFILTWIYNETGSVLLAILAHTGFNAANSTLVPLPLDAISAGRLDDDSRRHDCRCLGDRRRTVRHYPRSVRVRDRVRWDNGADAQSAVGDPITTEANDSTTAFPMRGIDKPMSPTADFIIYILHDATDSSWRDCRGRDAISPRVSRTPLYSRMGLHAVPARSPEHLERLNERLGTHTGIFHV
jgi:hypothetical protein